MYHLFDPLFNLNIWILLRCIKFWMLIGNVMQRLESIGNIKIWLTFLPILPSFFFFSFHLRFTDSAKAILNSDNAAAMFEYSTPLGKKSNLMCLTFHNLYQKQNFTRKLFEENHFKCGSQLKGHLMSWTWQTNNELEKKKKKKNRNGLRFVCLVLKS